MEPKPIAQAVIEPVAPLVPAATKTVSPEEQTIITLKVLSCILRAREELGRGKIAKILAGSEDTSVEEFRSLSTYGILSTYSIRAITEIIDHRIEEGYIDAGQGFRPTISVTAKGRQFLKDRPR